MFCEFCDSLKMNIYKNTNQMLLKTAVGFTLINSKLFVLLGSNNRPGIELHRFV